MRDAEKRDAVGVADARAMLETAYGWLEQRMTNREWAVGDRFSLADCAAAPALFYADWTYPK
jgi:glutathione S-transferase